MERDCPECEGFGFHEWKLTETRFKQTICDECWGSGKKGEEDDEHDEE